MPESTPNRTVEGRRAGIFNLLLIIGIIAAIALFAWAEQQRRAAATPLPTTQSNPVREQ